MALNGVRQWGTTAAERRLTFPCDRYVDASDELYRAVSVDAPPEAVFRWLCQLRAAPYSYDWIDNWGRRSPRELTPGLDELEAGQRVMTIFRLVDFEAPRQLTIVLDRGAAFFGELAVSYLVVPAGEEGCRLVVKLALGAAGPLAALNRRWLPTGDFVMMRKQLLTLKALAEGEPA